MGGAPYMSSKERMDAALSVYCTGNRAKVTGGSSSACGHLAFSFCHNHVAITNPNKLLSPGILTRPPTYIGAQVVEKLWA